MGKQCIYVRQAHCRRPPRRSRRPRHPPLKQPPRPAWTAGPGAPATPAPAPPLAGGPASTRCAIEIISILFLSGRRHATSLSSPGHKVMICSDRHSLRRWRRGQGTVTSAVLKQRHAEKLFQDPGSISGYGFRGRACAGRCGRAGGLSGGRSASAGPGLWGQGRPPRRCCRPTCCWPP